MRFGVFLIAILCAVCGVTLACQPPDCDHEDCGTCGNSCCGMQFFFQLSTKGVYSSLVSHLQSGGPDGRYTYKGGQDLRPYNTTADFILQGWHTTLKYHYNDTLNFNIVPNSEKVSSVTAFSISQIAGAYCDAGQNYKNLVGFMKSLGLAFTQAVQHGCSKTG